MKKFIERKNELLDKMQIELYEANELTKDKIYEALKKKVEAM